MSLFIQLSNLKISLTASRLVAFNNIREYACKLVYAAELAYSRRDLAMMELAGYELLNLCIDEAQNAGLYYIGIGAKRRGQAEESQAILGSVRGSFQPRAIQSLGGIYFEAGQFDEATRLYMEALNAGKGRDAFVIFGSLGQLSAIKSLYGDHEKALDDMLSLWPVMKTAAKFHPHLWPMFHNEIACEFLELGGTEEAERAISIALASPLASAYPEWSGTGVEISRRGHRASSIAVVGRMVSHDNLLRFDDEAAVGRIPSYNAAPSRVQNIQDWKRPKMAKGLRKEKEQQQSTDDQKQELVDRLTDKNNPISKDQLRRILEILREPRAGTD